MAARLDATADLLYRTSDLPSFTTLTAAWWAYLVNDRNNASDFIVLADGTNFCTIGVGDDGTTLRIVTPNGATTGSALSVSTWYHMVYTRSGSSHVVYLNGASNITRTDAIAVSQVYLMLGNNTAGNWLDGRLAGFKIWTGVALTAAEAAQEMATLRPQRTADLYGFWPMFAGASERVTDYSGNGRTLTAGGTLTDEDGPPAGWGASPLYAVSAPVADVAGGQPLAARRRVMMPGLAWGRGF